MWILQEEVKGGLLSEWMVRRPSSIPYLIEKRFLGNTGFRELLRTQKGKTVCSKENLGKWHLEEGSKD